MSEKEKADILAEVHRLIDEQMESLKGKLNLELAQEYAQRNQRIDQLLDEISRNGFKSNGSDR